MKSAASILSQIFLSTSLIEIEHKRILDLCDLMSKTIAKDYPLESLVGNMSVYHKSSFGNDVSPATVFHECDIAYFSRLSPYAFKKGVDLNSFMKTGVFNNSSYYVLYVSPDGLRDTSKLANETFAVELKPDQ